MNQAKTNGKRNREIEGERGSEKKRKKKKFEAIVRRREREQYGPVVDFALAKLKRRRFKENERKKNKELKRYRLLFLGFDPDLTQGN